MRAAVMKFILFPRFGNSMFSSALSISGSVFVTARLSLRICHCDKRT